MMKHLPSKEWRILILSALLVVSGVIYLNARFTAVMARQAKIERSAKELKKAQPKMGNDIVAVRNLLNANVFKPERVECLEHMKSVHQAEVKAIENFVGAPLTAANVFGYCAKEFYGSERECIAWLNEEIRSSLTRFITAEADCSAR
jgi:hypothetical protein